MSLTTMNRLTGRIPQPGAGLMRAVGQAAVEEIRDRVSRAVDMNDAPAKPLSAGYARQKARAGAAPVRDLRLTGRTMDAFTVVDADEKSVTLGFSDARAAQIAADNQLIDPMVGLSPHDQQVVRQRMQQAYRT